MAALVKNREYVRIIYNASTGKDHGVDIDGVFYFAHEYVLWLEDKVFRAAMKEEAGRTVWQSARTTAKESPL